MTERRFPWLLAAAAAANLGLALAVWTRQPWAGGPAEWRWEYLDPGMGAAGGAGAASPAGPANARSLLPLAAVFASVACLGWLSASRRAAAWRGALPLAIACGVAFTFGLVAWQPGGFGREMAALVSHNSFGYVWDAALAPPSGALLADYPAASVNLNQHSVTHPPGPLLLVRGLDALGSFVGARGGPPATSAAPGAAAAKGDGSLTGLAAAAIDREVQQARRHGRPVPRSPPSPWTVVALAVLLPAISALAAWPLFGLAEAWGCERREALLAAVLWLLVPARSLFSPSLDQALPALALGAAWLAARGGRRSAAAAGGLLFAACFISYGCLAILPLVAVCSLVGPPRPGGAAPEQRTASRAGWVPVWQRWAALALGFGLPYLLLALCAGHDPWHAMRAALALHQQIAVAPRSYATWLLWNPYDMLLLLSPAVLGLAALAPAAPAAPALRRPWQLAALAWWCLLALLLLAGSVRGEAGRIWLLWMPFACAFAAAVVWRRGEECPAAMAGRRGEESPAAMAGRRGEESPAAMVWRRGEEFPAAALVVLLASQAMLILALAARMAFVS
jgi:hypothetical protein